MAPAASPEHLRGRPCGASARRRRAPGPPITTDRTRGESPMPAPADAIRMLSAKPQRARRPLAAALTSGKTPSSLVTWYLGLTHHWMGDNPRVKTRILLGTHEWIIDRVLAPEVGLAALAADLRPDGRADAVTGRAGSARRRRSVAPLHRPRGREPAPRAPRARHAAQRGLGALALPDPVQHPADRRGRARAGGARRPSPAARRFRMRRRTGPRPSRTGRPSGRWRGCRSRRAPGTASPWPRAARTRRGRR